MVQSVSTSAITPTSTTTTAPKQELGKDSFVKLLLTQLQSQDPTAPQSSEEFVAQLAQFTSVELMQQQNSNLESLLVATAASQQTNVASLVGKDVSFAGDNIRLKDAGAHKDLSVDLGGPADDVVVSIVDDSGKTVRTLHLGPHDAGKVDVAFDGLADDGSPLPAGDYQVKAVATKNESPVDATVLQRGHVAGVSFAGGAAQLLVDGERVRLPDVLEIHERSDG